MGVLASRRSTCRRLPRLPPPTCRPDARRESARPARCARRS